MTRLLWLPEVLRAAGLTVHEADGWEKRGSDLGTIRGITCHATAGSRTSTDAGEIHVLLTGSSSAPAPIAQLYLSRSGEWWVIAAGRCNHNKVGWAGPNRGLGNSNLLGIEAQHSNTAGEPWTERQYRSYVTGVAALVRHLGIPVTRVAGHKEHQPYAGRPPGESSSKSDPTFDMGRFRADVTRALAGKDDDVNEEQLIAAVVKGVHSALKQAATPAEDRTGATGRQIRGYLQAILAPTVDLEALDGDELTAVLAGPAGQALADRVIAGLGGKSPADVAQALVAAGQNPGALAAALTALAADPDRRRG